MELFASQYGVMTEAIAKSGVDYPILRFMSRVGSPTDHSIIEALNGWMKNELYHEFDLRNTNDPLGTLDRYVSYFNLERPAAALNYKPCPISLESGHRLIYFLYFYFTGSLSQDKATGGSSFDQDSMR